MNPIPLPRHPPYFPQPKQLPEITPFPSATMISPTTIIVLVICYYTFRTYWLTAELSSLLEALGHATERVPTVPIATFNEIPDLARFLADLRIEILTILEFAAKAEIEAALLSVATLTPTRGTATAERDLWVPVMAAVVVGLGFGLWEHGRRCGSAITVRQSGSGHPDNTGKEDDECCCEYHCCPDCITSPRSTPEAAHKSSDRHIDIAAEVDGHAITNSGEDNSGLKHSASSGDSEPPTVPHTPPHGQRPNSPVHGGVNSAHAHNHPHAIAGPYDSFLLHSTHPHDCHHHRSLSHPAHHGGYDRHECHHHCTYHAAHHHDGKNPAHGHHAGGRKQPLDGAADTDHHQGEKVGHLILVGAVGAGKQLESKGKEDKRVPPKKGLNHGTHDTPRSRNFQEMFSVDE
jgi:hypothetical protein